MTNRIAPMMLAALGMCFGAPAALGQASALGTAREAVERRAAWKKGAVTLTWDSPHWPDGTRFYTAQFTRGEKLLIWHGDAEGVLARDRDGRPRNWSSSPFGPLYTLDTDEATWMVQEMDVKADMYRRTSPQGSLDVRSLGLTAGVPLFDPEHTLDDLRKAAPAGTRDGLELYVADSEHGRVTWWLDPQKGGLPVRVTREYEGR
ncbi:MAG TPA: hypothetical protein PKC49_11805, partial [Phycisphaerae bacterium]|nr:hypothetical protein [Phycisphaerae bacterium]